MLKACGYYVLIKMETVENVTASGIIIATAGENKRQQHGHDVGVIIDFGPTAFSGYHGIEGDTAEIRAEHWGIKIGDKIEFDRYEGKEMLDNPEYENYRLIVDAKIIGVHK